MAQDLLTTTNNPSQLVKQAQPAQTPTFVDGTTVKTEAQLSPQYAPATVGQLPTQNVAGTVGASLEEARQKLLGIQSQFDAQNQPAVLSTPIAAPETQTSFNEAEARRQAQRDQLRLYQTQIDATNQVYDQQLNQARLEGQGRLGSTRAIGARGGILGSDFASAQKDNQITANTAQQNAIQANRSAKIGAIMGNVRNSVVKEMEDKRQAYALGADAVLANIKGQAQRKQNNISLFASDLLAQGLDITDLSQKELDTFAKESGVSTNDLIAGYAKAKAANTKQADTKKYTLKQGETLVNAAGETLAKGADKPVVYKEGDLVVNADGTRTKIGKTTAPKAVGSEKGFTSGSLRLSSQDIGEGAKALESSRGSDGYANTQLYADMLSLFVDQGGLPQDFIKKFPSDLYLNPKDETVKKFIKTEMKSNSVNALESLLFPQVN